MSLIDYVRKGDYSELLPYICHRRESKRILKALDELSFIVRCNDSKKEEINTLMQSLEAELTSETPRNISYEFDGYPNTELGKMWIQAFALCYKGVVDAHVISMMENAIYIDWTKEKMDYNPKTYLCNYNRYIVSTITDSFLMRRYSKMNYIIILTTSSQYAFTDEDIAQIKGYMSQIDDIDEVVVYTHIDEEMDDMIRIEWGRCGHGNVFYQTCSNSEIDDVVDGMFEQEFDMMLLSQSDIQRMREQYDVCNMVEIISQNGVDDLAQLVREHLPDNVLPNSQMMIMCIEFSQESEATYKNLMKIITIIDELHPKIKFIWGTRVNGTLPTNGNKVTILSHIPDDFFCRWWNWDER